MKKTVRLLLTALVLLLVPMLLVACGHTHEYKTEWSYDGSHHWHEGACEHEKAEEAAPDKDFATHTMGNEVRVEPTCGQEGSVSVSCTVCGYKKVTILPAEGEHDYGETPVYRTQEDTIYAHRVCGTCGVHTGNEASYYAAWSTTATHHWNAPKDTDAGLANINYGAHEMSEPVVKNPTCGVDGSSVRKCKTCNYTETTVLPATGEHDYTKQQFAYKVIGTTLNLEKTCDKCKLTARTPVENSYVVSTTAEAQAALDAATKGTIIYFTKASFGTLYLRTSDTDSTAYTTPDWAGGGGTLLHRTFEDVTLMGIKGAKVDAFVVEAQTYTPGGNVHSNSAIPNMIAAITLKNLSITGITFTGEASALHLSGNIEIDGLTLDNCSFSDTDKENTFLFRDGKVFDLMVGDTKVLTTVTKNVTVTNCKINGAYQGIQLRGTENLTIKNNEFRNMAMHCILLAFDGTPYTGTISIENNKATSINERFLRADSIDADLTVKSNTIADAKGTDTDLIKITNVTDPAKMTVTSNKLPDGFTVTIPEAEE